MRYSRQVVYLGKKKQKRLKKSKVLIVGCGALGSTVANILARAGVSLRLVDRDIVEKLNLHRTLLMEKDIGKPKVQALKEMLTKANSSIRVEAVFKDFNPYNAEKLVKDCNVVVDGTDNMSVRYVMNDVCLKTRKPFVFGSAIREEGMSAVFLPGGPCFLCVFSERPEPGSLETCHTAGVLGTITSLIASVEASETIKILTGAKPSPYLLHVDLSKNLFENLKIRKNKFCESCVKKHYKALEAEDLLVLRTCDGYQITPRKAMLDLKTFAKRYKAKTTPLYIIFKFDGYNVTLFKDGRMTINTSDESRARSIYAKIVGF